MYLDLVLFFTSIIFSVAIHELTHYILAMYYSRKPKMMIQFTKIYVSYKSENSKKGHIQTALICIAPTFMNVIIGIFLLKYTTYEIVAYINFLNLVNLTPFTKDGFYFYKSLYGYFYFK